MAENYVLPVAPSAPSMDLTPGQTTVSWRGDNLALNLKAVLNGSITDSSSTRFNFINSSLDQVAIGAQGLTYGADQMPNGGIGNYILVHQQIASFSVGRHPGFSLEPVSRWIRNDQVNEAFATILSGNDDIFASHGGSNVVRAYGGNDRIRLNDGGFNTVFAGQGDDVIVGASTAFTTYLRGEEGNDIIHLGARASDLAGNQVRGRGQPPLNDAHGNQGNDTIVGGASPDWAVGGQGEDLLFGGGGIDIVYGNLGNDTLDGGAGDDIVRGGQGDDLIFGGAGDDYVSGDKGSDTIIGGAGADLFHTFAEAGIDRVMDFNLGEGDRVMLDPGTRYTLRQEGADTIIDMGSGNQMILVNVNLATLTPGWIYESWV